MRKYFLQAVLGISAVFANTAPAVADTVYADSVVSYTSGTLPNPTYNDPNAALGGLNPIVGTFGGQNSYLTPFNPAFSNSDLVEIGSGGSLELQLAAPVSTAGYTIGVHTGVGLWDADYPNGTNLNPAQTVNSFVRQADVQVSADGVTWYDLGMITFNNPSNYYTSAAADGSSTGNPATLADPGQPFLGSLSSFNGENWTQTLATLDGSAGGTWLDLGGVPVATVDYIKFVVPSGDVMMVDAVVGDTNPVPEPASLILLALGAPVVVVRRWMRRRNPIGVAADVGQADSCA